MFNFALPLFSEGEGFTYYDTVMTPLFAASQEAIELAKLVELTVKNNDLLQQLLESPCLCSSRSSTLLEGILLIGCFIFGSLLFVHFGRFMRW